MCICVHLLIIRNIALPVKRQSRSSSLKQECRYCKGGESSHGRLRASGTADPADHPCALQIHCTWQAGSSGSTPWEDATSSFAQPPVCPGISLGLLAIQVCSGTPPQVDFDVFFRTIHLLSSIPLPRISKKTLRSTTRKPRALSSGRLLRHRFVIHRAHTRRVRIAFSSLDNVVVRCENVAHIRSDAHLFTRMTSDLKREIAMRCHRLRRVLCRIHTKRRPTQAVQRATGAPRADSFRLLCGFGSASACIISPVMSIVNRCVTSTYELGFRTGCSMPRPGCVLITYCEFVAYSRDHVPCVCHVSVLSPPAASWGSARELRRENCRYHGGYEEAMGIQEKGHQGMVDRMVRRRQAEGQGAAKQSDGGTLSSYEVRATQFGCVHQRR